MRALLLLQEAGLSPSHRALSHRALPSQPVPINTGPPVPIQGTRPGLPPGTSF